MDDRLREFGEVPGYEFDAPRGFRLARTHGRRRSAPSGWAAAARRAAVAAAAAAPRWEARALRPTRRPGPAGRPCWPGTPWPRCEPATGSPAWPCRWLAAIAVGVAGVVVLGANNGGNAAAPSALAAGFPPARSAAADFGGGGRPVEVSAIAAAGATEVAVGSANRGCALWVSADGGSTWHRRRPDAARGRRSERRAARRGRARPRPAGSRSAAPRPRAGPPPRRPGRGRLAGRPHLDGHGQPAAPSPARAGSSPPRSRRARRGYVIVGHASAGRRTVAAAWYAPGLTGWRRAADARPGALDGPGNRMMNAVTATRRGFVAVGAAGARPAAWLSAHGQTWRLVTLALPAGAASAALDYVAANGGVVAAVGTEVTAAGQRRPFAAVSTDAGADWTSAPLPLPAAGSPAAGRLSHRAHRRGRRLHRDRHLRPAGGYRRRGLDAARRGGRGDRVDRGGPAGHRPGRPAACRRSPR